MATTYNTSKSSTKSGSTSKTTGGSTSKTTGGSTSKTTGGSTSKTTGGSISKSYASGNVSEQTQQNKDKYSGQYQQGQKVTDAYQNLQNLLQNKPGGFQSGYQQQLNDIYDKIVNREKFSFDLNENVMYDQLRDQYASLGKLAMQDTMGQAAALTGGYGNSFAQTAGQQSYQNYMQQLQEQIPSLYQMELNRYNQEGSDMLSQYEIAKNMYDTDYGQYRDKLNEFYTERDFLNAQYQAEKDFDYNDFMANRDYWTNQYWNEKNSEQTSESENWSNTETSNWSNTETSNWSNTETSNWSNTETSSWSDTTNTSSSSSKEDTSNSSTGGGDNKNIGSSMAPLSKEYVNKTIAEASSLNSLSQKRNYINALYNTGKISESNLNYFYDVLGLDAPVTSKKQALTTLYNTKG